MHGKTMRGLDYTPLFRFLISKVGFKWQDIYAEANSRIDKKEPIFWLVALKEEDENAYVRIGESSYFSGLKVDSAGNLQRVNPALDSSSLMPLCKCCTHTFNGVVFTKKYKESL